MPVISENVTLCPTLADAWRHYVMDWFYSVCQSAFTPPVYDFDTGLTTTGGWNGIYLDLGNAGTGILGRHTYSSQDAPSSTSQDSRLLGLLTGFDVSVFINATLSDLDPADFLALITTGYAAQKVALLNAYTDAADAAADIRVAAPSDGSLFRVTVVTTWDTISGTMTSADRFQVWYVGDASVLPTEFEGADVDQSNLLATVAATGGVEQVVTVLEQIANKDATVSINQNAAAFSVEGQVITET